MTVYPVLIEDYSDGDVGQHPHYVGVLKIFTDIAKANEYAMGCALDIWNTGDDGWYEDGFAELKYRPGSGSITMTAPDGSWTKVWVDKTEMD